MKILKRNPTWSICIMLNIKDYKFVCSLIIWHDLLNRINPISKMLQDPNIIITHALESIQNLNIFSQDCISELEFNYVLKTTKELSKDVDGEQEFKNSWSATTKEGMTIW